MMSERQKGFAECKVVALKAIRKRIRDFRVADRLWKAGMMEAHEIIRGLHPKEAK